jgi:sugar lactone lactonase YvrE
MKTTILLFAFSIFILLPPECFSQNSEWKYWHRDSLYGHFMTEIVQTGDGTIFVRSTVADQTVINVLEGDTWKKIQSAEFGYDFDLHYGNFVGTGMCAGANKGVWYTIEHGVFHYKGDKQWDYSPLPVMQEGYYRRTGRIALDSAGRAWFSTKIFKQYQGGGEVQYYNLYYIEDGEIKLHHTLDWEQGSASSMNSISDICVSSDGSVWVTGHTYGPSGGLIKIKDGAIVKEYNLGHWENRSRWPRRIIARGEDIWILYETIEGQGYKIPGGVAKFDSRNETWQLFPHLVEDYTKYIPCYQDFTISSDGAIWVATIQGTYRFNGSEHTAYLPEEIVEADYGAFNHTYSLLEDSEKRIWIGFRGILRNEIPTSAGGSLSFADRPAKAWPNPIAAGEIINIRIDDFVAKSSKVFISSAAGSRQEILDYGITDGNGRTDLTFTIDDYSAGAYFVEVISGARQISIIPLIIK